jgi:two-component system, cell cycle sensor histidine kinase and response regulator CckA
MSAQSETYLQVLTTPGDCEERFRQMAENIQEIFWMLDAVSRQVIYVSPAYERICGRSCASLYEAPLSYVEVIHPNDRDRVLARLAELVQGGEFDEEFRIMRPNGETRWVANQGFPIRDSQGRIYRVAGVVQDISKRKQVEQELRRSEERFETAFRSSPCSMAIMELPESRFVDVNKTFESESGYSREEVIGHTTLELGMWVDVNARSIALRDLQQRGSLTNREHQFRTKSGEVRTALYSVEMIEISGEQYALTTGKDITARKAAEEALRRSEAEYRSLFEGAPYGILRATVSGQILKANPALVRILGFASEAELLAVNLCDDVFGDPEEYRALISGHENSNKRFANANLRWKRKDGTHICVEASGRIFKDDNAAESCVDIMVQDVTERHALEAKLRRAEVMESVAEITSGLAHDYCTHLGRILGYADLLLHTPDLKGMPRYCVEQMIEAGMQARSVTRYLLGMTSKHELQAEAIRAGELIQDMEQFLQMFVGSKIKLSVEVDANLGPVRGDAQKLTQIVIDLIANARDAMPHGGELHIKVSALQLGYDPHHARIRPGSYVLISVSDTGHGMDQAVQSHIFDPFFTTKIEGKGAGLGLSYAQLIIEKQSGGEIRVSSQPGKGATFTVYLPCMIDTEPSGDNNQPTQLRAEHNTVLVVTEDDVLRKLASEFLRFSGFNVLQAKTAASALTITENRKSPVQLLLTDVVTLGKPGEDLANDLASLNQQMKVIYMADYGELTNSEDFLAPDGAKLLYKPFLSFELIAKVKSALAETTS